MRKKCEKICKTNHLNKFSEKFKLFMVLVYFILIKLAEINVTFQVKIGLD